MKKLTILMLALSVSACGHLTGPPTSLVSESGGPGYRLVTQCVDQYPGEFVCYEPAWMPPRHNAVPHYPHNEGL